MQHVFAYNYLIQDSAFVLKQKSGEMEKILFSFLFEDKNVQLD